MRQPEYIVIHHSGGRAGRPVPTAEDVRRWHLKRGWRDVGYHFLVAPDGTVIRGRQLHRPGAHVEGLNFGRGWLTWGVCFLGNFNLGPVPDAQWSRGLRLVRSLQVVGGVGTEDVLGHRETGPLVKPHQRTRKGCPGKHFDMHEFRSRLLMAAPNTREINR
jgi:hypothetical protein